VRYEVRDPAGTPLVRGDSYQQIRAESDAAMQLANVPYVEIYVRHDAAGEWTFLEPRLLNASYEADTSEA
jgi:hypothetical protein